MCGFQFCGQNPARETVCRKPEKTHLPPPPRVLTNKKTLTSAETHPNITESAEKNYHKTPQIRPNVSKIPSKYDKKNEILPANPRTLPKTSPKPYWGVFSKKKCGAAFLVNFGKNWFFFCYNGLFVGVHHAVTECKNTANQMCTVFTVKTQHQNRMKDSVAQLS